MELLGTNFVFHYENSYGYCMMEVRDNKVIYRGEYQESMSSCLDARYKNHIDTNNPQLPSGTQKIQETAPCGIGRQCLTR
jgi:hypothetical protein